MKKYRAVRPDSTISKIVNILFYKTMTQKQLKSVLPINNQTLVRCIHRARQYNLLTGPPLSLTPQGRLYHISCSLNVSMPELVAISSIYSQLKSWDDSALRHCTVKKFAIRDYNLFSSYTTAGARSIYSRLISKGIIRTVSRHKLVTINDEMLRRLSPYHGDIMELYKKSARQECLF